jgi:hypothetical protein
MEKLLEKARVLLGWPTLRKVVALAKRFPEEEWWEYAVAKLEEANTPNEAYLIRCLETARDRGKVAIRKSVGPYPGGLGDRGCPWFPGLYCPGATGCEGLESCPRGQYHPGLVKAMKDE